MKRCGDVVVAAAVAAKAAGASCVAATGTALVITCATPLHKTDAVAVTAGVGSSCSSAAAGAGAAHRTTPERRLNQRQDCARVTIIA